MNKLVKNIYYVLVFGLSTFICLAILFSKGSGLQKFVSSGLILMYTLILVSLLTTIVLAVKGMVDKPKSAMMTVSGLVVMGVLVAIGYFMDDHSIKSTYVQYGVETEKMSGLIGGSLIATWIILGAAVAITLVASVMDFVKKL